MRVIYVLDEKLFQTVVYDAILQVRAALGPLKAALSWKFARLSARHLSVLCNQRRDEPKEKFVRGAHINSLFVDT